MVCLRCGHCCIHYCVAIVDDPEKGINEDNIIMQEGNSPCKHLQGNEPGKYSCGLHNYEWYNDTPCFQHGQIEHGKETECRLGRYILNKHLNIKV